MAPALPLQRGMVSNSDGSMAPALLLHSIPTAPNHHHPSLPPCHRTTPKPAACLLSWGWLSGWDTPHRAPSLALCLLRCCPGSGPAAAAASAAVREAAGAAAGLPARRSRRPTLQEQKCRATSVCKAQQPSRLALRHSQAPAEPARWQQAPPMEPPRLGHPPWRQPLWTPIWRYCQQALAGRREGLAAWR